MSSGSGASARIETSSGYTGSGRMLCTVEVVARDGCSVHPLQECLVECSGRKITGYHKRSYWADKRLRDWFSGLALQNLKNSLFRPKNLMLFTKAHAQFTQLNVYASNVSGTVLDVTNAARTIAANTATGTINICAGTTGTAAAFADHALGAQSASTSGLTSATVNALSGNAYTITATITNTSGGSINYNEVGIQVTAGGNAFLTAHDAPLSGGPYSVSSPTGTLTVTYTHTWS